MSKKKENPMDTNVAEGLRQQWGDAPHQCPTAGLLDSRVTPNLLSSYVLEPDRSRRLGLS